MNCHCGLPLHYKDKATEELVLKLIEELGEFVPIQVGNRKWLVQRHFIALHGIKAQELPNLGFEEVMHA